MAPWSTFCLPDCKIGKCGPYATTHKRETRIKLDCWGIIKSSDGKIILRPFQKPVKRPNSRQFGTRKEEDYYHLSINSFIRGRHPCALEFERVLQLAAVARQEYCVRHERSDWVSAFPKLFQVLDICSECWACNVVQRGGSDNRADLPGGLPPSLQPIIQATKPASIAGNLKTCRAF